MSNSYSYGPEGPEPNGQNLFSMIRKELSELEGRLKKAGSHTEDVLERFRDLRGRAEEELHRLTSEETSGPDPRSKSSEEEIGLLAYERRVQELEKELDVLKAERAGESRKESIYAALPRPGTAFKEGATSLERVVLALQDAPTVRDAVLADLDGLVVAGSSDHADTLAAVAAMVPDICAKTTAELGMGQEWCFTLSDKNGLTFTAQPFVSALDELILATLSQGPGPERQDVESIKAAVMGQLEIRQ